MVVVWGLNFVAMKVVLRDFTPFQLGAARYLLAAFSLVLLVRRPRVAWRWLHAPLMAWAAVAWMAWMAWMASVLGYALWTRLLQRHPANRVAPFSLGVPVVGLSVGMGLLGESSTRWQWGGIALTVLALGCVLGGEPLLQYRCQR